MDSRSVRKHFCFHFVARENSFIKRKLFSLVKIKYKIQWCFLKKKEKSNMNAYVERVIEETKKKNEIGRAHV